MGNFNIKLGGRGVFGDYALGVYEVSWFQATAREIQLLWGGVNKIELWSHVRTTSTEKCVALTAWALQG